MIKEASFRDLGRVPAGRMPKERILRGSLAAQALKLDGRRVLNQSTRMGGISRKLRKVRPLNSGPPWSPHENQMLTLREIEAIGLGAHAALVGRAHGYGLVAAGGA